MGEARILHPVHHERCTLRDQVRLAYRFGWREPMVFFEKNRPLIAPHALRLLARAAFDGLRDLLYGDRAGAVDDLLRMTRCAGEMTCRWSPAYRQRAAMMEKAQPA